MSIARDIALIFLSLEALVILVIPLAFLGGLIYGVHRLRPLVKKGLRTALSYAKKAHAAVEQASLKVAAPFLWLYSNYKFITTIIQQLTSRRSV